MVAVRSWNVPPWHASLPSPTVPIAPFHAAVAADPVQAYGPMLETYLVLLREILAAVEVTEDVEVQLG